MAKKRKGNKLMNGNGHANGHTKPEDKRFCPELLKKMEPNTKGQPKPFTMPKYVADGAD